MSLDYYNSLMETVHLLKSPANVAHLTESIAQFKAGRVVERETIPPAQFRPRPRPVGGVLRDLLAFFMRTLAWTNAAWADYSPPQPLWWHPLATGRNLRPQRQRLRRINRLIAAGTPCAHPVRGTGL